MFVTALRRRTIVRTTTPMIGMPRSTATIKAMPAPLPVVLVARSVRSAPSRGISQVRVLPSRVWGVVLADRARHGLHETYQE